MTNPRRALFSVIMTSGMSESKKPKDLREACVAEAMAIIATDGVESLSLRDVARRLGVSHQAPYKHFPSRDHILAEIVTRAYADFARHLDQHAKSDDPDLDMAQMGRAYLEYANGHPLEYRLMFGTPLPPAHDHPEMMREAKHAFGLLCDALRRRATDGQHIRSDDEIVLDALFVWSGLHGLASITSSSAIASLGIADHLLQASSARLLQGFGQALGVTAAG